MSSPEAPSPRFGSTRWVLAAMVAVLVLGAGLVYAVQAEWKPEAIVKPYDPLQSW